MHSLKFAFPVAFALLVAPLGLLAAPPTKTPAPTPMPSSPWSFAVETGIGYDSNAYQAPSDPYIDYAPDPDPVPLTSTVPVVHSGVVIPADVSARYAGRARGQKFGTLAGYSLDANLYPASETRNANEYDHRLEVAFQRLLNNKRLREDTVTVGPYLRIHDKTYYDRDTGEKKVTNRGTDLSNRYSYTAIGVAAELDRETAALPHKLRADYAKLNYDEPSASFTSYDHAYYALGGDVDLRLARGTKAVLGYDYRVRDYDERQARSLSGSLTPGTARKYTYNTLGASLRNRVSDSWVAYIDYAFTDRKDDYVGYGDYTENVYGFRVVYDNDQRVRARMQARWRARDYENAFAFDDPGQPRMTYDTLEIALRGDLKMSQHYGLWAEFRSRDQDTTDLRYRYDRYLAMIGMRWTR